jgi:hypothetical protein
MEEDAKGYESILSEYDTGSPIVDIWAKQLNAKDGVTFNLQRVDKTKTKPKASIEEMKLGENFIRGIVPDSFLPENGKEFRMYHYTVDGNYNFGIVTIKECDGVKKEGEQYVFGDATSDERFVLTPCYKAAN